MFEFRPITESPLYKISPKYLARLLGFDSRDELEKFVSSCEKSYLFFEKDGRSIQTPHSRLKEVHKRLSKILGRIEVPPYLQSAVKGTSYIKNAEQHVENRGKAMFTMDIKSFFPSTSYKYIWKCFVKQFQCDEDVASILTRIVIIHEHLPVGSSISTILSFYGYRPMFDKIARICQEKGVTFTCYVDDLTCSGNSANRFLAGRIRQIIRKFGLTPHPNKTRYYHPHEVKMVTGVALTGRGKRLPNSRRKAIHEDFGSLSQEKSSKVREVIERRLKGRLGEAALIEERFKTNTLNARDEKASS
jgi:RNA-directed DNA polymerase